MINSKSLIVFIVLIAAVLSIYHPSSPLVISENRLPPTQISHSDSVNAVSGKTTGETADTQNHSDNQTSSYKNSGDGLSSNEQTDEFENPILAEADHLKIFGNVLDSDHQPISDVLVTENKYHDYTRTDSEGKYKMFLDLTEYQDSVLHFLRSGFEDKEIELKLEEMKNQSTLEINVVMNDDVNFISAKGWIGNEAGIGLEDLKIQLSSKDRRLGKIYHTAFSDMNGYFSLEGIRAGERYRLTVSSTPDYTYYVDEEFVITHSTPPVNIILESIKYTNVDGMIVNNRGTPIPNFEIYIRNISTGFHVEKLVSDSSGFFRLENFPTGEVSVTTLGPEYFKISGLILKENEYGPLHLVVDKGDHYLSGLVNDESGMPIEKALVMLEAKSMDGDIEYSSYRVRGTDRNGAFQFDNLGSGEHRILVNAPRHKKQEIIHQFRSQTDEVNIILPKE